MNAVIENVDGVPTLVISLPVKEYESATGKSIVIASSHGCVETDNQLVYKGKVVKVSVNAFYKPK